MLNEKTQVPAKSWAERQALQEEDIGSYFFAIEKQHGATAIMLDLEFENGNHLALAYSGLMKIVYERSKGITLEWGSEHISIIGRNLGELYSHLIKHRVKHIREGGSEYTSKDASELVVQEIQREKEWE